MKRLHCAQGTGAFGTATLLVAWLATATMARGAEFEFTSRGSYVSIGGDIVGAKPYDDEIFADHFGVFDEELEGGTQHPNFGVQADSFAWQRTSLDAFEIEGFGESWATWTDATNSFSGNAHGDSFMELEFSLASDTVVSFSGELFAESDGTPAIAEILLEGPVILEYTSADGAFGWEGVLPAGDYFLGVDAFSRVDAAGDADLAAMAQYDFLLTVVPEPGALSLLVFGVALIRRRR